MALARASWCLNLPFGSPCNPVIRPRTLRAQKAALLVGVCSIWDGELHDIIRQSTLPSNGLRSLTSGARTEEWAQVSHLLHLHLDSNTLKSLFWKDADKVQLYQQPFLAAEGGGRKKAFRREYLKIAGPRIRRLFMRQLNGDVSECPDAGS